MGNDLEGKVILLTGGASGIGRECAVAYAREGATIAILNRNCEEGGGAAKESSNRNTAYHADVANGAEIQSPGDCPHGTSSQMRPYFYFQRKAGLSQDAFRGKRRRRAWLQTLTGMGYARIQNSLYLYV
ncbi:MAG: SDR family NAD(P)-dependent oxidoreductase [Bryobacteraceae bacterium]